MKNWSTPITFTKKNGCRLFGILHRPENKASDLAVILLSPGIKGRVAPHRMYVKMAERFCTQGFWVLRFDPEGLGDSEGEINEEWVADVYGIIEQGGVISDTIQAMDFLEEKFRLKKFILAGLCGGAITGLLAGAQDRRVIGLLGLGITCIVSGSTADPARYITKGQLDSLRQSYLQKLFKPSAWLNFISGKSDYRVLFKSLILPVKKMFKPPSNKAGSSVETTSLVQNNTTATNFNQLFPGAFFEMVSDRQIFLIFSEADRLFWEYSEKFAAPYAQQLKVYQKNLAVSVVKNANHIFSFTGWKAEMLELACNWIEGNFNSV